MRTVPLLALLLVGCVSAPERRYPPPPPPAPPQASPSAEAPPPPPRPALISESEAVRIAARFARSRGLDVQRYQARLVNARWRVDLRAQRGDDRAQVLVDARDGRVLKARLRRDDPDWDRW